MRTGNLVGMPEETEHHDDAAAAVPGERTGMAAVDRVLASVETVGEMALAERLGVFEHAQDELRRALDAHPTADIARG